MDTMSIPNSTISPVKIKKRPTPRQKKTLAIMSANGGKMQPAMIEAGYSPSYAKSAKLAKADSFKDLLNLIDDNELINQARDIALGDDKRASLVAIDMLLKLKDRYPAGKLKVQEYQDELENLSL